MNNVELAALILPWAKEKEPEKYDATIKVARVSSTFRRYMIRLVEIRCQAEPDWRRRVPMSVLEETSLEMRFRQRTTGLEIVVKGLGRNEPREWGFKELAACDKLSFAQLHHIKTTLDMELVDK